MTMPPRRRSPPKRTPEVWAREFLAAFEPDIRTAVPVALIVRASARDFRLRERAPASMASIAKESAACAGVPVDVWLRMSCLYTGLFQQTKKRVRQRLGELEKLFKISRTEAVRLLRHNPVLVCFAEGGLQKRMSATRRIAGVPVIRWRACVRRCPGILSSTPAAFEKKIKAQQQTLGLTASQYREFILRDPRVLNSSAKAIETLKRGLMRLWGLSPDEIAKLIGRTPGLVRSGPPETLDKNLDALACGLGVSKDQVIHAVKLFTPLAWQKPERLLTVCENAASVLAVSRAVMAKTVLRSPSLLARRTDRLGLRMRWLKRIARACGSALSTEDVLEKFPTGLTYAEGRLLQRYVIARLGLATSNWTLLLTTSNVRAQARLREYLIQHPERSRLQRSLERRGLL